MGLLCLRRFEREKWIVLSSTVTEHNVVYSSFGCIGRLSILPGYATPLKYSQSLIRIVVSCALISQDLYPVPKMLPIEILLHGQLSNSGLCVNSRANTYIFLNGYCSGIEGRRHLLGEDLH